MADTTEPMLVTIREAARLLSVCRRSIYTLCERGDLIMVHVGRSARIRRDDLTAYVAALAGGEAVRP